MKGLMVFTGESIVQLKPFKHGMVVTNEPGLYISGSHGIRLENELIVRKTVKNGMVNLWNSK